MKRVGQVTNKYLKEVVNQHYQYGFVTAIESESFAPGLSIDVIRKISKRKNEPEFLLNWRLRAYEHWLTMKSPNWAQLNFPEIDYQKIIYYSAPKLNKDAPQSLADVDPKLLE